MATNAQKFQVFKDEALFNSILIENLKQANLIINEDPGTANHANRLLWAQFIIADPWKAASKMLAIVMSNADIQNGDSSDATVGYVVEVLTNIAANV